MFKILKKKFIIEPILVVLNLDRRLRMEVNILDYVIKEVLSIECSDRRWRLVTYFSKSLNEIERNYEIYVKEILVVIRDLEN